MHYWNKNNFEGLKSVGEKYSSMKGYELFGKYCLQKESGLNKQAISSIKRFVIDLENRPISEQRNIAEELSALGFWNREIHQLLAYPLAQFLKEVLENWIADEPDNPIPHKWQGYISGDTSYYERALELDPKDDISINRLAQAHLDDVDYQTHHLSESLFLGEFSDAQSSLDKAAKFIATVSNQELKEQMQVEFEYYKKLLVCWNEYSKLEIEQSFPDWSRSKGENFNFLSIVYYD